MVEATGVQSTGVKSKPAPGQGVGTTFVAFGARGAGGTGNNFTGSVERRTPGGPKQIGFGMISGGRSKVFPPAPSAAIGKKRL